MIQEKEFDAYIGNNGMVVFAIEAKEGEPIEPHIKYSGGDHALLYRSNNPNDVVVLDYLHPEIKQKMSQSLEVFVAEIDYDDEQIVHEYIAKVEQVFQMPQITLEEMG